MSISTFIPHLRLPLRSLFLLLLGTLSLYPLSAQIDQGGTPSTEIISLRRAAVGDGSRVLSLAAPKRSDFVAFAKAHSGAKGEFRVLPVGMPIATDITPANSGTIGATADGRLTWQVALQSPEARSLQLFFGKYRLLPGARLFILSPEGNVLRGAFTEINNSELEKLAIAPIEGDALIIYYEGPQGESHLPQLQLTQVGYGFISLNDLLSESNEAPALRWGEPSISYNEEIACSPAVVTKPDVATQAQSDVLLMIRGSSFCSGSLINNTAEDGAAYILTASHCMNASYRKKGLLKYAEESAAETIFFFNYKSPLGKPIVRGCEEQSLAGAKIVALNEELDMCLLKIVGTDPNPLWKKSGGIPASFMPYYAGWNVENDHPEGPFICLHHPHGNVVRYSRCDATSLQHTNVDINIYQFYDQHYLINKWNIGTTAPGSSGSPLYDKNRRIVGALTGGNSYCTNPINDYYYILQHGYELQADKERQLKPWLDPIGKGTRTLDGFLPYGEQSPQRLSYNIGSVRRDEVENHPHLPQDIKGIAMAYKMRQKNSLLGAFLMADLKKEYPEEIQIALYRENNAGERALIKKIPFRYPEFQQISGVGTNKVFRSPGTVEFFIPFAQGTNEAIFPKLEKDETLLLAIEADNSPLLHTIYRSKPYAGSIGYTFFRIGNSKEYVAASHESLPEEVRYTGNYWIDPVIMPLEKVQDSIVEKPSLPTAHLFGGFLRIYVPIEFTEPVDIAIYAMDGKKLFDHQARPGAYDIAVPTTINQEKSVVVYLRYEGGKYGHIAFPNFGL